MLTPAPGAPVRPIPGPGFIAACAVSTWVDSHSSVVAGHLAWLLIGHAPARRQGETAENIEDGLLGMAAAMRLRPAEERVPHVGERLIMRRAVVALDYGHPEYVMRIPHPGDGWRAHAACGLPVCVALGLDPIPPGAGAEIIERYLHRGAADGRVLMGATGVRPKLQEIRCIN